MEEVNSIIDSTTLEDASDQVGEEEETSTAEPEPEEPAEESPEEPGPEPETEEESEEVEDPFNSKGVQKRITKLIDRATRAETERDELKQELETLQSQPRQTTKQSDNPLKEVTNQQELDDLEGNVKALHYWLIENPDGGIYKDSSGNEHEIAYEQARKLQVSTAKDIADNIPARKKELQTRQQATAQAMQTFPWMKDQKSQEYNQVVQFLAQDHALNDFYQNSPIGPLLVGYVIEGTKTVQSRNQKAKTAAKAPSVPGPAATAPVSQKTSQKKDSALRDRALQTGNRGDVANYLETIL
tara:strand:- start:8012 stop:8908 length:897 start_codon:yes stop_codon:yes gene_type:complete